MVHKKTPDKAHYVSPTGGFFVKNLDKAERMIRSGHYIFLMSNPTDGAMLVKNPNRK